jgi:hypothetical protein
MKERKAKNAAEAELPFLAEGTKTFPVIERAYDTMILNKKNNIDVEKLKEKLRKRILRYYEWLANENNEMPPLETNMMVGCKKALTVLKANGIKFEVQKKEAEFNAKGLKENLQILEVMHITGNFASHFSNYRFEC